MVVALYATAWICPINEQKKTDSWQSVYSNKNNKSDYRLKWAAYRKKASLSLFYLQHVERIYRLVSSN